MAIVYRVTSVNLSLLKRQSALLLIMAEGETRTGGYKNCRLNPVVYVNPPEDGIWEFTFEADEPTGPSTNAITNVAAHLLWEDFPKDLKGVRVMAEENFDEASLEKAGTLNFITGAQQSRS